MSLKNGHKPSLKVLPSDAGSRGRVKGRPAAPAADAPLRLVYVVPSNRWCLLPAAPVVKVFVTPPPKVLVAGEDDNRPVAGMMDLALLSCTLEGAPDGAPYMRAGVTGFAVPVDDIQKWNGAPPPDPVQEALRAFVMDPRWPSGEEVDPLVIQVTMLMPPSIVEEGGGFGGEMVFPEGVR